MGPWGEPSYGVAPVWSAPSPGVVPLRPLGVGELLDGAWQTMRHNPRVMFGLSALVMAVAIIVSTLLQLVALGGAFADLMALEPDGSEQSAEEAFAPFLSATTLGFGFLVPALVQSVAMAVLNGMLIVAVSDAVLGRRPTASQVLHRVGWRGVGRLLLLTLLTTLLYLGVLALVVAPVVGLWFLATPAGIAGTVLGIPLLVALMTWLTVRLAFAAPALLLEGLRPVPALRRSWRLCRGSFWRVLGVLVLAGLISAVAQGLLQLPFSVVGQVVAMGMAAGSTGDPTMALMVGPLLLTSLGSVVSGAVVAPFIAAVTGLLYIDLRIRREGLDVALARAAGASPTQHPAAPYPAAPYPAAPHPAP